MNFWVFQTGDDRYRSDVVSSGHGDITDARKLAFFVGLIALALPVVLYLSHHTGVCRFESISHYYYSRFLGGVFVGALFFIAAFLLAYKGGTSAETWLASLAGFAALGVALFPTSGPGCTEAGFVARPFAEMSLVDGAFDATLRPEPNDTFFGMFPWTSAVHYGSAAVLFLFLAWYSFYVFTRTLPHQLENGERTPNKRRRDAIYRASGRTILVCVGAIGLVFVYELLFGSRPAFWNALRLTFWFEAIALVAFGLSWMVNGRFYGLLLLDEAE